MRGQRLVCRILSSFSLSGQMPTSCFSSQEESGVSSQLHRLTEYCWPDTRQYHYINDIQFYTNTPKNCARSLLVSSSAMPTAPSPTASAHTTATTAVPPATVTVCPTIHVGRIPASGMVSPVSSTITSSTSPGYLIMTHSPHCLRRFPPILRYDYADLISIYLGSVQFPHRLPRISVIEELNKPKSSWFLVDVIKWQVHVPNLTKLLKNTTDLCWATFILQVPNQ
eukprot:GHVS01019903.1.p1 GENE.GHVS01019903.1~~GHVS01019903.1.p1  ORF type:complete len:225 (-),score=15.57 GHVS01019903.1:238-912(-)